MVNKKMSYKLELSISDFAFTEEDFIKNQLEVINEILNKKDLDLNNLFEIEDIEYNADEELGNHYSAILNINFNNENELKDFLDKYQEKTSADIYFNVKQEEETIANEVNYSKNTRKFKI